MIFNGRNVQVSSTAKLGQNVRIGDNTVIHDQVEIGDNTTIANNCVIGEPLAAYFSDPAYRQPPTRIGANSLIRSHAIIYAGSTFGEHFSTGHRVIIRENTFVGHHCRVGTNCDLQGHLTMGDHCQLHSQVHLCQFSAIGHFVFIYPNVVLGNDRHPPTEQVKGPTVDDHTQVGIQSSIIGDVRIGQHCLIGAGAVVTKDFDDYSLVVGSPAERRSDVRELLDSDGRPLYPWKNRFSRGMPWQQET